MSIAVGKYTFDESEDSILGVGNYGYVYRGTDTTTGTQVALKKIGSEDIKPDELTIMGNLRSDFIVALLDVCEVSNFDYLIFELCDCDLNRHLKSVGTLSTPNLNTLVDCLARGYSVLHQMEIVHRDIKPHNILLQFHPGTTEIRLAKYSDFGISREVKKGSGVKLYNLAGTPNYMAPEIGANILDSQEYSCQVDMWAIGVVLFEAISGDVPFDEGSLCKLFLYAANRNYHGYKVPPLPENIGDNVRQLITALLEIDFQRRMSPAEFFDFVVTRKFGTEPKPISTEAVEPERQKTTLVARYVHPVFKFLFSKEFIIPGLMATCSFCLFPHMRNGNGTDVVANL